MILRKWLSLAATTSSTSLRTKMQVARERLSKYTAKAKGQPAVTQKKKPRLNINYLSSAVPETLETFRPTIPSDQKNQELSGVLKSFMQEAGFGELTDVQRLLFERITAGKHVYGGAETGSGKTLAYLMPLVCKPGQDKGKVVVCVPTKELVSQVLQVAKSLAHHCKFRARTFQQEDWVQADLLIGLPREFANHPIASCSAIVVDEADTLFLDPGFADDVRMILDAAPSAQRIVVSATMPPTLLRKMKLFIPEIQVVTTKGFLKPVDTLRQHFSDLKVPQAQKPARCLDLLLKDVHLSLNKQNLIFCNSIQSAQDLYQTLLPEPRLKAALLHGKVSPTQRGNVLKAFHLGRIRNLITTDLLARGVDLPVDNVVLYDFPHTLAEYLHRVGRTARAGRPGRVFALITSRDRPFFFKIKSMLNSKSRFI